MAQFVSIGERGLYKELVYHQPSDDEDSEPLVQQVCELNCHNLYNYLPFTDDRYGIFIHMSFQLSHNPFFYFFPLVSLRCVLWMETSYLHQGFLLHRQSLNCLLNSSVQRQENSLKERK